MSIVRRIAYKLFGARVPLWEDLRKRRRVDRLRRDGIMLTVVDSALATLRLKGMLPQSPLVALEPFGRMGLWKTMDYAHLCQEVDFYEIDGHFAKLARDVLPPHVKVHCESSIDAIQARKTPRSDYNIVVIDNPMGNCFGGDYCEHFDLIPALFDLVAPDAVLIANVFRSSLPAERFEPAYVRRRSEFFQVPMERAMQPSVDDVFSAYRSRLPGHLRLRDVFTVPHPHHPSIPNDEVHFVIMTLGPQATEAP